MDEFLKHQKNIENLTTRVEVSQLFPEDEQIFLGMVRASHAIHHPWVSPPSDTAPFQELLTRNRKDDFKTIVVRPKGERDIIGVFNISQIFYRNFQNSIMGYYTNIAYHGQGYMREGLLQTVVYVFFKLKLHRIEANVICENERSIKFVKNFGFRHEGMSKNYLYIDNAWRDHEKFALTREDWEDVLLNFKQAKHAASD